MSYIADKVPEITKNEKDVMPKRVMPVRISKIELDGDFNGWWFIARTNPKMRLFNLLMAGTFHGIKTALAELLVGEWNFVDEAGDPLPQPDACRRNHEKWEAGRGKATEAGNEVRLKWLEDEPLSPEDLIEMLTIDLVIAMGQAVGSRVQEVQGN